MLVFGRNPALPNLINAELPALNDSCDSDMYNKHINVLNSARKAFIHAESCKKLQIALRSKIRAYEATYKHGDNVYYKKDNIEKWLGPARVMYQDGKVVFVRHGSAYIRVSTCRIQHCEPKQQNVHNSEPDTNQSLQSTQGENMDVPRDCVVIQEESSPASNQVTDSESITNPQADLVSQVSHASSDVVEEPGNGNLQNIPDGREGEEIHNSTGQNLEFLSVHEARKLKKNDMITYRDGENDPWKSVKLLQRVGKKNGPNQYYFNVESDSCRNGVYVDRIQILRDSVNNAQFEIPVEANVNNHVSSEERDSALLSRNSDNVNNSEIPESIQENDSACAEDIIVNSDGDIKLENVNCVYASATETVFKKKCQSEKVKRAKMNELEKLYNYDTYDIVPDEGQDRLSMGWVITEKSNDEYKARLVVRGFEELSTVQSDSPTISRTVIRIFFTICASFHWKVEIMDIQSAFLQGKTINRDVYVDPPKEFNQKGMIWKLRKCLYGLSDASRSFYLSVKETLQNLGCETTNLDHAIFFFKVDGVLQGAVLAHVDDFIFGGSSVFQDRVMRPVKEKYIASQMCRDVYTYTGWEIEQLLYEICLRQTKYTESLKQIDKIPLTGVRVRDLSEDEKTVYRSIVGKLNWLVQGTRPDLSFALIDLSTKFKNATTEHLKEAYRAIKKVFSEEVQILYPDVGDIKAWTIYMYCDASFANLQGDSSCSGYIVFIGSEDGSKACPIVWHSGKVKRVVSSTIAAETLSLNEGIEQALYVREIVKVLTGFVLEIKAYCDNRSIIDSLQSTKLVSDKNLRIDISKLKDYMSLENVTLKWVPGAYQLADCLTKSRAPSGNLMEVLKCGNISKYIDC